MKQVSWPGLDPTLCWSETPELESGVLTRSAMTRLQNYWQLAFLRRHRDIKPPTPTPKIAQASYCGNVVRWIRSTPFNGFNIAFKQLAIHTAITSLFFKRSDKHFFSRVWMRMDVFFLYLGWDILFNDAKWNETKLIIKWKNYQSEIGFRWEKLPEKSDLRQLVWGFLTCLFNH